MPVKLQSSSGGSVTLQTGSTASNYTHTVPSVDGTVMVSGNMPAFSAYQSSQQTLSSNTFTKIQLQTKEFDTNSCFDNTTNYRFTPTVAGYYQVTASISPAVSASHVEMAFYKNGSAVKRNDGPTGTVYALQITSLIYMNGTTDYLEFYAMFATGQNTANDARYTYFQGFLARAA
jgi:hypothetical protein